MSAKALRKERRLAWLESRLVGRVLDVGCSSSMLGERACARGHEYVGVDIDADAVAATRSRLSAIEDAAATVVHASFETYSDPTGFDTVVLAEVLEHQAQPSEFLARARGLLREGGQILVTTPFSWMPDPTHLHAPFAGDHLEWMAAAGLRAEELEVGDYHVRTRLRPGSGCAVGVEEILRQTEAEAEAVIRFWIGERDRQSARVETLIARTEHLVAELEAVRGQLRATRLRSPLDQAKRLVRSVRRRVLE